MVGLLDLNWDLILKVGALCYETTKDQRPLFGTMPVLFSFTSSSIYIALQPFRRANLVKWLKDSVFLTTRPGIFTPPSTTGWQFTHSSSRACLTRKLLSLPSSST